jgi:hypothetical protein
MSFYLQVSYHWTDTLLQGWCRQTLRQQVGSQTHSSNSESNSVQTLPASVETVIKILRDDQEKAVATSTNEYTRMLLQYL